MFLRASSQPTATHTLVELLATRALPTKINKVLISGPTQGRQIM